MRKLLASVSVLALLASPAYAQPNQVFSQGQTGSPITATTGGVTGTLPAGQVTVVSNKGTTNLAYCKLGASATVNDVPIAPNGGWFVFNNSGQTQITCITASSTTVLNLSGGSGTPAGTGGGGGSGGGGGGGAVTIADGADTVEGTLGDTQSAGTVVGYLKSLWTQINASIGVIGAATAPTSQQIAGCVYNSTPLTLTNGQSSAVQCDANGYPKVNVVTATGVVAVFR